MDTITWLDERISEQLHERRRDPRQDPLTELALMEVDGEPIPHRRAVTIARVLIAAGIDTTGSAIGSSLVHMHFHPELRERLQREPELWPVATEEFIRRFTPARYMARTCTRDMEFSGVEFKAGDRVFASLTSANQDEGAFERPLDVSFDRESDRHMSFGMGVHRCLGMHLARAEFTHVVSQTLKRIPDYVVDDDQLVLYSRQSDVTGWMQAPATFTPGARVLPATEPGRMGAEGEPAIRKER
jgi:cytochrome P450